MFTRTIADRFEIIRDYVSPGRAVMDLGCVDSRPARHDAAARIEYKANLLHKRLAEINKDVLGVDIDPEGVKVLNSQGDRKSTRLNSSHSSISYAVFCLKKKKKKKKDTADRMNK